MRPARLAAAAGGALVLIGSVVFLRLPSFGRSVIDWDESVYLIVSRALLQGNAPYTLVWDHKPPGIYVLFAFFQLVLGQTVDAVRAGACAAVAATSLLLFFLGRSLFGSGAAGALAAVFYSAQSLRSGGLAANTELFFAPLTTLGVLLLVARPPDSGPERRTARSLMTSALAFGLAIQVKFVSAFELAAIAAMAILDGRDTGAIGRAARTAGYFLLGAALPLLVTAAGFLMAGHLREYAQANFMANLTYAATDRLGPAETWAAFRDHARRHGSFYWGAMLFAAVAIAGKPGGRPLGRAARILGFWMAGAAAGILSIGRVWDHYFLQLLPPLSLMTAGAVVCGASLLAGRRAPRAGALAATAASVLLLATPMRESLALAFGDGLPRNDVPERVAAYLAPRIRPDEYLYVADDEPILYYLVRARIPTAYVLPYDLLDPDFARMAGFDRLRELDRIFSLRPAWVVVRAVRRNVRGAGAYYASLTRNLSADYEPGGRVVNTILFRRREATLPH